MSWKQGSGKGPWGNRPPSTPPGGGHHNGGGPNRTPPPPDLDEFFRKGQESLRNLMGGRGGGIGPILIIGALLLALWGASGFYRVDADEQGVVMRFGQYHRISQPGLNYHLPYPVETVFTPKVTNINREQVGFRSSSGVYNTDRRNIIPEESLMLTGDKNIVSAQFEVQWRIKDAEKFLFNVRSPEVLVKPVAETSMREIMGKTPLSLALSDSRQVIAEDTKQLMQAIMDEYEAGIEIYEVNLLAVDAPEPVVDAFIDVLAAQQEKETLRNQAMKYRDGILPVAQGQVEKMIKDAQGYKEAIVSKARGDSERFISIYNEYKSAKDVTRKRMYLDTMEQILSGMQKVIMSDGSAKSVTPYLPLPAIEKQRKAPVTEVPAPVSNAAPSSEYRGGTR